MPKKAKSVKAVIHPGHEKFLEVYGELRKKKHLGATWVMAPQIDQSYQSWEDANKSLFWSYIDDLPRDVNHFVLLSNMSEPKADYKSELMKWKERATELAVLIREHLENNQLQFTFAFTGYTEEGEINGTEHQPIRKEDFLSFESSPEHSEPVAA